MGAYLDNAATSIQKPEVVYEAMDRFMRSVGASPGRSAHAPGIEASRTVADAREAAARLIGVKDSARIVFTLNCTEALNLAIKGLVGQGGHVVVTSMEHNSVLRPLSALIEERGIDVTTVLADAEGWTDPADIAMCIREDTALVVMTHASNVTGTIQPLAECGKVARERGVPFLVDAAQTAGAVPIDVDALSVDLLAFSGHKGLMGPQGTGGLYVREGIDPAPLKHGGTGSRSTEETQPADMPDRYESGTPNTPGLAGLCAALRYIEKTGVHSIRESIVALGGELLDGLRGVNGLRVFGPTDMSKNVGVFSIVLEGWDNAELAQRLEEDYDIMTRVGLQCSPSAHKSIGTFPNGTVRISIGYYTTAHDVSCVVAALNELAAQR